MAENTPSRRHPSARISSAARNPTVGPSWPSAWRAPDRLIVPMATSSAAPTTAAAHSGSQRGGAMAAPSVVASARSARTSATQLGKQLRCAQQQAELAVGGDLARQPGAQGVEPALGDVEPLG